ncbi:MAG: TIR domain-containing protein, partial [Symploca sp. SIO1C4]|nr:TIR domain-containing protein [Symploca sp. SIO1C4]
PGSGKSTALVRLLLEEAEQGKLSKIPVLVELRYYQTSVLDLIRDFCQRHRLWLESAAIEQLLFQGQLLLLVDGINELPSDQARRDLQGFRNKYQDTPMIFTTRDLGVGGDLDIAKKLEMQPLTEVQTQQFIRKYLPEQGEQLLKQLGPRLRELGQTPLLLMMLCSVFLKNHNQVPANLGSVFRQFTQIYDNKLKQDIPASGESRRWWHRLLQHLAWVMSRGESLKEIQVAIPRQQAEDLLTEFLQGKVAHPEDCALCWLEDLLKYHLIQLSAEDKIEFRHQLIQEYYTAEYLLKLLPSLSDEELKREYLNYLKWTATLVLMLELVDSQAQAVRVVKLALEVDLLLGARLAGAVKPKWQEQTVSLVAGLEVSQLFKVELLGLTKSERAVYFLNQALEDEDYDVRRRAAYALGNIGTEAAITALISALEDQDSDVRQRAAYALGAIGTEAAITALISALEDQDSDVRQRAAYALGNIGTEAAIPALISALEDEDSDVRWRAAEALGKIGSEAAIPALIRTLEAQDSLVRWRAAEALGKIGTEAAITALIRVLEDENYSMGESAASALGKIGTEAAITALIRAIEAQDSLVRVSAASALGKIGSEAAIPALISAVEDQESSVRGSAASALGKIGTEAAIPALIRAIEAQDSLVRGSAASALGKIGSEAAIPALIRAIEDQESSVRSRAASALGKIGSEAAIPALIRAVEDQDSLVRRSAAEALGKIGTEAAITALIRAIEAQDSLVRVSAASALGKIGTEAAITALISALKDQKFVTANNGNTFDEAIETLQAIQEGFKFYNYTLTQPHLPPAKPNPICPMNQKQHSPSTTVERNQVFISYSHQDKIWLERLQTMLKPLMRNQTISVWDDTRIRAGAKWREEITKALAVAKVAVLMVSSNFLASDFIAEQELPPLLKAAEQQGLTIIWVYLSACMYKESEIGDYQAAHNLSKPLNTLDDGERDLVLLYICQEIKAAAT